MAENILTDAETGKALGTESDGKRPEGAERLYTEAEVASAIAIRLSRKDAQYADYDELKKKAGRLAELEQAQMSELEQAQARATALEAERDEALQRGNDRLIVAAITMAATKLDFANPQDAYALADLAGLVVNESGEVEGAEEAVKVVADTRPYLIERRIAPQTNAGAGGGGRPSPQQVVLSDEELRVARRLRVTPEQYAEQKAKISSGRG